MVLLDNIWHSPPVGYGAAVRLFKTREV